MGCPKCGKELSVMEKQRPEKVKEGKAPRIYEKHGCFCGYWRVKYEVPPDSYEYKRLMEADTFEYQNSWLIKLKNEIKSLIGNLWGKPISETIETQISDEIITTIKVIIGKLEARLGI